MKKLHVCVVTQQFTEVLSGPGLYARNLVDGLLAVGHKVTLVVPSGVIQNGTKGMSVTNAGTNVLARRKGGWILLSFFFGRAVRKLRKKCDFDIIHFTDAKEALFTVNRGGLIIGNINDTYIAGKTLNPLYYKRHYPIDWIRRWIYLNLVSLLEGYTLKRLRLGVCNSRFTRNVISRNYNVPDCRLALCYKSICLDSYVDIQISNTEKNEKLILFAGGGNAQRKGLISFLKAADIISKREKSVRFLILGRDNVIPKILRKYCSKRVAKTVQHILYVPNEDMKLLYAEADVFVMPSIVEAFGVVYLESMASGTAVIGTTNGGAIEFISDRKNGLLVQPDDANKLASLIVECLSNDSLRSNLERNGMDLVKDYSVEKMIRKTLEIYHDVCN